MTMYEKINEINTNRDDGYELQVIGYEDGTYSVGLKASKYETVVIARCSSATKMRSLITEIWINAHFH